MSGSWRTCQIRQPWPHLTRVLGAHGMMGDDGAREELGAEGLVDRTSYRLVGTLKNQESFLGRRPFHTDTPTFFEDVVRNALAPELHFDGPPQLLLPSILVRLGFPRTPLRSSSFLGRVAQPVFVLFFLISQSSFGFTTHGRLCRRRLAFSPLQIISKSFGGRVHASRALGVGLETLHADATRERDASGDG